MEESKPEGMTLVHFPMRSLAMSFRVVHSAGRYGSRNRRLLDSGFAVLARNDGLVVFVIPAKAGIQGVWGGLDILFLSRPSTSPSLTSKDSQDIVLLSTLAANSVYQRVLRRILP